MHRPAHRTAHGVTKGILARRPWQAAGFISQHFTIYSVCTRLEELLVARVGHVLLFLYAFEQAILFHLPPETPPLSFSLHLRDPLKTTWLYSFPMNIVLDMVFLLLNR